MSFSGLRVCLQCICPKFRHLYPDDTATSELTAHESINFDRFEDKYGAFNCVSIEIQQLR